MTGSSRPAALLLAVVTGGLLLGGPAAPAGAATAPRAPSGSTAPDSLGVRLLDVPADRADDPRARTYVVDALRRGETVRRRVEVSNTTDAPMSVQLYAAAADVRDGRFVVAPDREADELSSWTTVAPGAAVVPAHGAVTATVTLAVPGGAGDGERYGVVWAQTSSAEGTVRTVDRVGVRMYVAVGDGTVAAPAFSIDTLTAARRADGRPVVRAAVHNTGGRALDLSGDLQLSGGPGGTSAGPFAALGGLVLAPGQTGALELPLAPDLPAGPWLAQVTARSGTLSHTVQASLTFPATGEVTVATMPVARGRSGLVVLAVGLVLLLGAAVLAALLWARRPRQALVAAPVPPADPVDPAAPAAEVPAPRTPEEQALLERAPR